MYLNLNHLSFACSGIITTFLYVGESAAPADWNLLPLIRAPQALTAPADAKPLIVAIVDDGFRMSHAELAPFLWVNPREIAGNRVDDDGNGMVDDINGWDVADGNADTAPPQGREEEFYHGTHMAGIIVRLARHAYGEEAHQLIKILPVKSLEDDAPRPYLKSGYQGIEYAIDAGADVILTAWGEPNLTTRNRTILERARERGILVIASSGNAFSEIPQYPAAFPSVISVTAIAEDGARINASSYGGFVDLLAPGVDMSSTSSRSDTGSEARGGTSVAAAVVAGAAAILKVQYPMESPVETTARLKKNARPAEGWQRGEILQAGKLGAGLIDLDAAVKWSLQAEPRQSNHILRTHQGYLARYLPYDQPVLWRIRPEGEVKGFWFEIGELSGTPGESRLQLFQPQSELSKPFLDVRLRDWNERLFIPGPHVMAILLPDPEQPGFQLLMEYASEPIQQSTLFCGGTTTINQEGIIEDGSGDQMYSPQSDCKWLITAPPGMVIHLQFLEFNTEANTDWLYFFDGSGTHEPIMAAYSGTSIPPELTTWRNQVLIWFVTNESRQGSGWKAQVRFINPPNCVADAFSK